MTDTFFFFIFSGCAGRPHYHGGLDPATPHHHRYSLKDVFSACMLPHQSMTHASENGNGFKVSKERLTVLVSWGASGEKLPLLMIGKAPDPCCFLGYEKAALGIRWEHNTKAWMTLTIFHQWLEQLNNSMVLQGHHILLFIDNCTAHPDV